MAIASEKMAPALNLISVFVEEIFCRLAKVHLFHSKGDKITIDQSDRKSHLDVSHSNLIWLLFGDNYDDWNRVRHRHRPSRKVESRITSNHPF